MIKSVKINNIKYNIDDGLSLQDKATEELDSMTFVISNVKPISLEPFQNVEITFANDKKRYMIINTWIEEVATIYGLKRYIINCISETKKLERVQLPNMTITQPLNSGKKRTYDLYLSRNRRYFEKVYPELYYDNNMLDKLSEVIAVEEQFNSPNYKEYLNSILTKISSVCRVENGVIGYLDLSKKNNAINEEKILFRNDSQTIEDYYSDIRTDVQGVQSERPTTFTEIVGIRSPENAVLTYDNAVIQLGHNINYIEKVIVYAPVKKDIIDSKLIYKLDITNYVKEKKEYDTLLVSNALGMYNENYKRMNIYYDRGSNLIQGLTFTEKTWFVGLETNSTAIENIVYKIALDNGLVAPEFIHDIRDYKFEITYSSLDDVSTEFSKEKSTKSVIRDNQVDSYIDLDKFAKTQQEKINRLGNPVLEINARYYSLEDVPELMDYIGDYILAEREIVYHRDYIDFKGTLYKDYVKKNLFYGVNAKRRSTQLIMGNEAVERKELVKEKYKFSFEDDNKPQSITFQRYLLGKIASNNYEGERFGEYALEGEWEFREDLISGQLLIDKGYNQVYVKGDFNFLNIHTNEIKISRENNKTSLSIYDSEFKKYLVLHDGEGWVADYLPNSKFLKYTYSGKFDTENYITSEEFIGWLELSSARKITETGNLEKDQNGMTKLDFKPIQLVSCKSLFYDGSESDYYKLEPDAKKGGNSIFVNFKWYDNINVGMKIGYKEQGVINTLFNSKGGYSQEYVGYTDNNGEVDIFELEMFDKINLTLTKDNFDEVDNFPSIPESIYDYDFRCYGNNIKVCKDNREVINLTLQFEFSTEDNIFITDKFVEYLPLINNKKEKLYVWISETEKYDKYNCTKVVQDATNQDDYIYVDSSDFINFYKEKLLFKKIKLYNNNEDISKVVSWALADENGNVYLAVNKRDTDSTIPTEIYLNKEE